MGFFGGGGGTAGVGGATGSTDNAILRADGTGGATLQNSALVVDDAVIAYACTGVASTDIITAVGHNFTANQGVRFTSLTGGSGLATTTNYFVRDISGDTFKVSTTSGGSAVNFTTDITAGTIVAHNENVTITNQSSDTNSSVVITPKGTGAFILGPKPDGTTTGGNRRGDNATDLQMDRAAAPQVASGQRAFLIGSHNSTASAQNSGVIASGNSSASGTNAVAMCADSAMASGGGALAISTNAVADRARMIAFAGGAHSLAGDAQGFFIILRNKTTTNSAVELFIGTTGTTRFTIPSGKVVSMLIHINGVKSDGSAVAHYLRQYALKNVGGTTSEVYAPVTIGTDNAAGTSISIDANDTNDAVRIQCTGIASETWRWTARIDGVETAYGT